MSREDEEELQRIQTYMLAGRKPILKRPAPSGAIAKRDLQRAAASNDQLDAGLRMLGYNRPERERLRRSRQRSRSRDRDRDRGRDKRQAALRLAFYIDRQVDWTTTDLDRKQVIASWAHLCGHDVEKANGWWAQGVHPLDIAHIRFLKDNGFQPADLCRVIQGKTVLEHLHEGSSPQWCLLALSWATKA
ncbi:hypothetical protein [Actinomadura geliboluensis]|uniref:Uncharacterized protein n=1 Tax=Actinomadura geliboluensis TaxID=882440 RepID=A0A5S4GY59_9ACTN|nr:hypothetical protein [Actinomadura geliboluensis]TMR37394.1 hypothetical protein ETD96_18730 [Actinomadura geliboluensis]